MDISIVREGAILECTLGYKTSKLKVPRFHGAKLEGGNQANISDYVGNINIMSFCKCKRTEPFGEEIVGYDEKDKIDLYPCNPTIVMKWLKGQKDCILDDDLALLKICIVPCMYGGIVKIKDSGQQNC